jgi:DNA-binding Lrp family transcriptional regulator
MHELYAFVNIFVESPLMDEVVEALSKIDAVVELYEVTGEYDLVMLVYASDIEELSDILKNRIMKIKGVKSTITSIALSPQKGLKCLKAATETAVSDNKNSM